MPNALQTMFLRTFSILGMRPNRANVIIRSTDKDMSFAQSNKKCDASSFTRQHVQRSEGDLSKQNFILLSQHVSKPNFENKFSWGWSGKEKVTSDTVGQILWKKTTFDRQVPPILPGGLS